MKWIFFLFNRLQTEKMIGCYPNFRVKAKVLKKRACRQKKQMLDY